MKAEHRRELETNALADRMGRAMQRVQHENRRTLVLYAVGAVALLIVLFFVFLTFQNRRVDNSERWFMLEDGSAPFIEKLARADAATEAGKAARFQKAWFLYWELGLKRMGNDAKGALAQMDSAAREFAALAEECAGDPVWEPEARYALAVIEENKAVQSLERLETARNLYKELVAKHPDSAHGRQAKAWLARFEDDKRKDLAIFYQDMRISVRVPEAVQPKLKDFQAPAPE
jgi:hypothetical protein